VPQAAFLRLLVLQKGAHGTDSWVLDCSEPGKLAAGVLEELVLPFLVVEE